MKQKFYSPNHQQHINSHNLLRQQKKEGQLRHSLSGKKTREHHRFFQKEKKIGAYVYDVSGQIGKGFSSIVYRGVHFSTSNPCAVKVVNFKDYNASSMKMMEDQIKILRSLDHPNIIKCFDVYKTRTNYYIITEYCPQKDLYSFLNRMGTIQQALAVQIISQISEGVKYLMSKGIVHRDLKPANILRADKQWKIADFGFAMKTETPFKSKLNVGTPLYMAPQVLVDNLYSFQSDIFSIGVIFYEMLAGRTPWECHQEKKLIEKIMKEPYSFPDNINVSAAVVIVIKDMCTKSTEERMDKEQFMKLNILNESINPEESSKFTKELKERREKQKKARSKSKPKQNHSPSMKLANKNNHILLSQLHFCRFIYYFIRNMKFLETSARNKSKLTLVLYHHLEKLINLLSSNKTNYFQLEDWHEFKQSKKYETTLATLKQYAVKYRKEYDEYLKDIDVGIVQNFNRNFHSLGTNETFTTECFEQIQQLVSGLLRQVNHNINIQIKNKKDPLSSQTKAAFEALKTLLKYYQLVELSLGNFQDFGLFEKECGIRVQVDYLNCENTLADYSCLRDQLKNI